MFRTLLETAQINLDGRPYAAHYFKLRTARGAYRYSCEIVIGTEDRIILDDDSVAGLQTKVACVTPAILSSRALASGRRSVAAA